MSKNEKGSNVQHPKGQAAPVFHSGDILTESLGGHIQSFDSLPSSKKSASKDRPHPKPNLK